MSALEYRFDVVVVGAGHAGIEAALAAARLGLQTCLLTMNADAVAQMSCNPAIGGVAKGQIVREIDALGGVMGKCIDASGIQFRMLNASKGPAMHSPRAQADKKLYQFTMKRWVEEQANLTLRQEMVEGLLLGGADRANAASRGRRRSRVRRASSPAATRATSRRRVVLTTGTFLKAIMHTGEAKTVGGRAGDYVRRDASATASPPAGFELARFKTGTPCRLNGRTIDFSQVRGAARRRRPAAVQLRHRADHQSAGRSATSPTRTPRSTTSSARTCTAPRCTPGRSSRRGPRYCPSIEDKVVRFADKDAHQIFLEPEGLQHPRVLLQRHQHQPAQGRAAGDAPADPRPGERGGDALGLRGRVRLRPADAASPDARNQAGRRAVLRRPDQRHHRLRGGRRPGADGRASTRRSS